MLNIYDFFNSPDVAGYCQSIGHTFNAAESAILINKSNTRQGSLKRCHEDRDPTLTL